MMNVISTQKLDCKAWNWTWIPAAIQWKSARSAVEKK